MICHTPRIATPPSLHRSSNLNRRHSENPPAQAKGRARGARAGGGGLQQVEEESKLCTLVGVRVSSTQSGAVRAWELSVSPDDPNPGAALDLSRTSQQLREGTEFGFHTEPSVETSVHYSNIRI